MAAPVAPPPPPTAPPTPPTAYAIGSGSAPAYRAPTLPPWLTAGALVVLAGAVLAFAGFVIEAVGTSTYAGGGTDASLSAYLGSQEWGAVLIGLGILVAGIGWVVHQLGTYRRLPR